MNNDKIESDVRDNKVKEGLLLKQSRHLKEWKQRWMVLTKTHLYSFNARNQLKNPTEVIALKDVETIKSYYKDQYKPYTFRVESPDVNLHMSAKNADEKWAWMTAIEKMIEKVIHPENKVDTYNLIRETLKMSTAVRQTMQRKQEKERKASNNNFEDALFRKLRISLNPRTVEQQVYPTYSNTSTASDKVEETFFILQKKQDSPAKESVQAQIVEPKVIEKIVHVPVQKIVQRIVKVPEIRQKIIQKIVYKESPRQSSQESLQRILRQLIANPGENPKPLADFVVYLLTSKEQRYQAEVLRFCLDSSTRRFFTEFFLLMMNEETDEMVLNTYLKFILVIYQNCEQFFYSSDLKALIGILLRELEMNRSEFNQYLIMTVFKSMCEKAWWKELNYRRNQILVFIKEISCISGEENQFLASELLQKL